MKEELRSKAKDFGADVCGFASITKGFSPKSFV
jgi:hypothetical protein